MKERAERAAKNSSRGKMKSLENENLFIFFLRSDVPEILEKFCKTQIWLSQTVMNM